MIYEHRVYRVASAKRRGFITFFGQTVVPLLTKHGAKFVGVWETEIGERNNVIVLLSYKDITERMKVWEGFEKDPEWNKHKASLPQESASISILKATSYSPLQ